MNERLSNGSNSQNRERQDELAVARLLHLAGPRAGIPSAIERRVHAKVYDEWRQSSAVARGMRRAIPFALAAGVLLAIAIGMRVPDVPLQPVGSVARVIGNPLPGEAAIVTGTMIHAGDTFRSGPQSVSISLNNGVSIRLRQDTEVSFADTDELALESGALYADTGQAIYRARQLVVHTPAATTTDVGTQFMVTYVDDTLSVAVREGMVDVANDKRNYTTVAGEKLTVTSVDDVLTEEIPANHASWTWAEQLAPPFDIENRSLLDFLKWFARETGRELSFASDDVRLSAMQTKLSGSISDMTPIEAAHSVLSSTAFRYQIDRQSVQIDK